MTLKDKMNMKKLTDQDAETKSPDLVTGNIDQIKTLFPEAFTEGKVDFEVLKQLLGGAVEEREEKYGLNWHGKRRARQLALTPSNGTLRPCPQDSVDWDTTRNLMIEGDNLEVLKLLQKSYAGKVKLIYIDPPYNTGKDFVYPDNFQDNIKNYLELTGQVEGGRKISSNTEASGRFHTDWLNMMYPRLKLARNLLREDGVIFVSIDNTEIHNLGTLCNDVFGEENFVEQVVWLNKEGGGGSDSTFFRSKHEYLSGYARDITMLTIQGIGITNRDRYTLTDSYLEQRGPYYLQKLAQSSIQYSTSLDYPIEAPDGSAVYPGATNGKRNCYRWSKEKVAWGREQGFIEFKKDKDGNWQVYSKQYLNCDNEGKLIERTNRPSAVIESYSTTQSSKFLNKLFGAEVFKYSKPHDLISYLFSLTTADQDIVIDFFAGSGTTGHAVMAQNAADNGNRRYILVQLPEPLDPENKDQKTAAAFCDKLKKPRNIAELTKERLRLAAKKIKDDNPMFAGDLGFRVFKLASSNIRAWEPDRDNLAQTLEASVEHLKTDRTEADILFELLLKLGLDLTVPIEGKTIAGKTVHSIGAGTLIVCLALQIIAVEVEPLALGIVEWYKQLGPAGETTVVFRDSAFADDVAKTNLAAILQQHGLENVRSL
jgi:adenine-specific DNA-methyltransferase